MTALLVVTFGNEMRQLPVDRSVVLGRDPGCDLHFDDPQLSRKHVRISQDQGAVLVTDLSSRNGTRVNGRLVDRAALRAGDVVCAGHVSLICKTGSADTRDQAGAPAPHARLGPGGGQTRAITRPPSRPGHLAGSRTRGASHAAPPARLASLVQKVRAALRRPPSTADTDKAFGMSWRRRLLATWLAASLALLAWPAWCVVSASGRRDARLATLGARWVAAEARHANDAAALDRLGQDASELASLDGVQFLDDNCAVLSPSPLAGRRHPGVPCPRDGTTPLIDAEATGAPMVIELPQPSDTGTVWIVARPRAREDDARTFWTAALASLMVIGFLVWSASQRLFDAVVGPLDRFVESAAAALRAGPGHLGGPYGLVAIDRVAEMMEFLLAQPRPSQKTADVPRANGDDYRSRPEPPIDDPREPPSRLASTPGAACGRLTLTVSPTFEVEHVEGDAIDFGLRPESGRHVLDVLHGDPAVTDMVLAQLAAACRSGASANHATECETAAGRRVRVLVRQDGNSFRIQLAIADLEGASNAH